jgi:hypothetical protein
MNYKTTLKRYLTDVARTGDAREESCSAHTHLFTHRRTPPVTFSSEGIMLVR